MGYTGGFYYFSSDSKESVLICPRFHGVTAERGNTCSPAPRRLSPRPQRLVGEGQGSSRLTAGAVAGPCTSLSGCRCGTAAGRLWTSQQTARVSPDTALRREEPPRKGGGAHPSPRPCRCLRCGLASRLWRSDPRAGQAPRASHVQGITPLRPRSGTPTCLPGLRRGLGPQARWVWPAACGRGTVCRTRPRKPHLQGDGSTRRPAPPSHPTEPARGPSDRVAGSPRSL